MQSPLDLHAQYTSSPGTALGNAFASLLLGQQKQRMQSFPTQRLASQLAPHGLAHTGQHWSRVKALNRAFRFSRETIEQITGNNALAPHPNLSLPNASALIAARVFSDKNLLGGTDRQSYNSIAAPPPHKTCGPLEMDYRSTATATQI